MVVPIGDERPPTGILWSLRPNISGARSQPLTLKFRREEPFRPRSSRVQLSRLSARHHSPLRRMCGTFPAFERNRGLPERNLATRSSPHARRTTGIGMALPALLGTRRSRAKFCLRLGTRRSTARRRASAVSAARQCRNARAFAPANCSAVGAASGTTGSSHAGLPRKGRRSLPKRNALATASVMGRSDDFS